MESWSFSQTDCPGIRLLYSLLTLAAVVLQADPPVITLALGMQLCVDPRNEAWLVLWPQGHITEVGPAAQTVGAASSTGGVEGVEIRHPCRPMRSSWKQGSMGGAPPRCTSSLQESITLSTFLGRAQLA